MSESDHWSNPACNHGWWRGCMVAMSYIGTLVENSPYSWMRRGIVSSLEAK